MSETYAKSDEATLDAHRAAAHGKDGVAECAACVAGYRCWESWEGGRTRDGILVRFERQGDHADTVLSHTRTDPEILQLAVRVSSVTDPFFAPRPARVSGSSYSDLGPSTARALSTLLRVAADFAMELTGQARDEGLLPRPESEYERAQRHRYEGREL